MAHAIERELVTLGLIFIHIHEYYTIFTALHVMQMRYCDENSVCPSACLSVRLSVCLSVRHMRGL